MSRQFYKDKLPNGADYAFPLPYDNIIPKIFDKIQSADCCSGSVAAHLWTHDRMCFDSDAKRIKIHENDCGTHENDSFCIVLLLITIKMNGNESLQQKTLRFAMKHKAFCRKSNEISRKALRFTEIVV